MTYQIPLGSLGKDGISVDLGPNKVLYGNNKYGVDALSYNNYHVKHVTLEYMTALNQMQAKGHVCMWLTGDPNAGLPTTDDAVLNQVTSSGVYGRKFFSAKSTKFSITAPLSNQMTYQTGNGDSSGTGSKYQAQLRLNAAVVGKDAGIESYGLISATITVGWSSPGAPNIMGARALAELPKDTIANGVWGSAISPVILLNTWTTIDQTYREFLVIEENAYPVLRAMSEYVNQPTAPPLNTNDVYQFTTTLPKTNYEGKTISVVEMAWDDEHKVWASANYLRLKGFAIFGHQKVTRTAGVMEFPADMVTTIETTDPETGEILSKVEKLNIRDQVLETLTETVKVEEKEFNQLRTDSKEILEDLRNQLENLTEPV